MIDKDLIMPLNFFAYGGIYSGENKAMRYRMARIGEKPDFLLEACVWKGPFAYDAVKEDCIVRQTFPFDEDGRLKAIEWIQTEYDSHEEYSVKQSILDTKINLDDMYVSAVSKE